MFMILSQKNFLLATVYTSGLYYKSFTIIIYNRNVQFTIIMTVTGTIKLRS